MSTISSPPTNVPWFPDGGDPRYPENVNRQVKPIHRFVNDYHQTYDIICWLFENGMGELQDYMPTDETIFASPLLEFSVSFTRVNQISLTELFGFVLFVDERIYTVLSNSNPNAVTANVDNVKKRIEFVPRGENGEAIFEIQSLRDDDVFGEITSTTTVTVKHQDGQIIIQDPEDITFVGVGVETKNRFLLFERFTPIEEAGNYVDYIFDLVQSYRSFGRQNADVTSPYSESFMQSIPTEFQFQLEAPVTLTYFQRDNDGSNIIRQERISGNVIWKPTDILPYSVTVSGDSESKEQVESAFQDNLLLFNEINFLPPENQTDSNDIKATQERVTETSFGSADKEITCTDANGNVVEQIDYPLDVTSETVTITSVFTFSALTFVKLSRANYDETDLDDKGDDYAIYLREETDESLLELFDFYFFTVGSDGNRTPYERPADVNFNHTFVDRISSITDAQTTPIVLRGKIVAGGVCSANGQSATPSNDDDSQAFRTDSVRTSQVTTETWEDIIDETDDVLEIYDNNAFTLFVDEYWHEYYLVEGTNTPQLLNQDMPDSIRVKEIHQALEASRYATYTSTLDGELKPRISNIGYYVERMARLLGINVLADGTAYTPKLISTVEIPEGGDVRDADIPVPYLNNQWGFGKEDIDLNIRTDQDIFEFNPLEETDAPFTDLGFEAMVYPIVSNKFVEDEFSGEFTKINAGDVALVHNLPQLYDVMMQDVDKGLGLQEAGAFSIRSPNDVNAPDDQPPQLCYYEGLHSLVAENAVMNSEISRRASKAEVVSMINQALLQELMSIMGLPIEAKSFQAKIGANSSGEIVEANLYHPAFANNAPRLYELWTLLMQNIAPLLGNNYRLDEETEETVKNLSPEELEEFIEQFKNSLNE
jgi:hypothetical protein